MSADYGSLKLSSLLDKIDQNKEKVVDSALPKATPTTVVATDVPYGWVEYFDPATKRPYYHNIILNTTQWEKPEALINPPGSETAKDSDYVEKAYFSKESGRFSGTTSYWQKMGREDDKAGRQLGVFMDLSTLEENREQAKVMKEEARKKSGSRGEVDWSQYKEQKKAAKKRKASEWVYDP